MKAGGELDRFCIGISIDPERVKLMNQIDELKDTCHCSRTSVFFAALRVCMPLFLKLKERRYLWVTVREAKAGEKGAVKLEL